MKTIKEVAVELKLSEQTIRKLVKEEEIKSVKYGRQVRISDDEFERLRKGE